MDTLGLLSCSVFYLQCNVRLHRPVNKILFANSCFVVTNDTITAINLVVCRGKVGDCSGSCKVRYSCRAYQHRKDNNEGEFFKGVNGTVVTQLSGSGGRSKKGVSGSRTGIVD